MHKCFEEKRLGQERLDLIQTCNEIIETYMNEGYTLTIRQLYYQLVAKDLIPNTVESYNKIQRLIRDGRMAGLIDWDAIEDRGRKVITPPAWKTPRGILRSAYSSFQIDHWKFQPCHVMVMCEKQALEGVLEPASDKWNLPYVSNKGFPSTSLLYNLGQEFEDDALSINKSVHVIYYGDHDPSGLDMDRDLEERLAMFSDLEGHFAEFRIKRIALTMEQIEEYQPPPNPAKLTDTRAQKYIRRHGKSSWELDALEPRMLVNILDAEIEEVLNVYGSQEIWEDSHKLEEEMKKELNEMTEQSQSDIWEEKTNVLFEKRNDWIKDR